MDHRHEKCCGSPSRKHLASWTEIPIWELLMLLVGWQQRQEAWRLVSTCLAFLSLVAGANTFSLTHVIQGLSCLFFKKHPSLEQAHSTPVIPTALLRHKVHLFFQPNCWLVCVELFWQDPCTRTLQLLSRFQSSTVYCGDMLHRSAVIELWQILGIWGSRACT